ncbi:flagellar protein FliT [Aerosticca soli]|jgi:hypothetical protein|uniref:Flagellar protein FliT n=1 Tax=Aerosticca soli TaxID=2010829 RepID=A0A2Z6E344_9GAMM|nr:flagellar protein FliT [Aerosticca soli]MDI3262748.1 flagellar protein FliT [Fulvimonas sp.]BBD79372.1 hypothetical protein ALSL_0706 [Aerosticca soli]
MNAGHEDDPLERALSLSVAMVIAAKDGLWETVAALDSERQPLLRGPIRPDRRSRELLEALLEHNEQVRLQLQPAHAAAAAALGRHQHAHQALRAYVDLAG